LKIIVSIFASYKPLNGATRCVEYRVQGHYDPGGASPFFGEAIKTKCKNAAGEEQTFALQRFGGARRIRTDDILLAKQALYQLSYGPSLE